MIDIHSHILPGLDDGSDTLEESVAMLRMAAAAGTTDIVASPHANQEYAFDPLAGGAEDRGTAGGCGRYSAHPLRLRFPPDAGEYRGCACATRARYSINHRGLSAGGVLRFPDSENHRRDFRAHDRARPAADRDPSGAQPACCSGGLPELEAWVAQGVPMQVTAQSLLGRFGRTANRRARTS